MVDTRDLAERREALKQEILDSFLENFPHYEEMTESFEDIRFEEEEIESWKEDFEDELKEIIPAEEQFYFSMRIGEHGRQVCKAKKPDCENCCMKDICVSAFKV